MKTLKGFLAALALGLILALCGTALASDRKEVYVDSETGVRFSIEKSYRLKVIGEVPEGTNLIDDLCAKKLLSKGFEYAKQQYPAWRLGIDVFLFKGEYKEDANYWVKGNYSPKGNLYAYYNVAKQMEEKFAKAREEAAKEREEARLGAHLKPSGTTFRVEDFYKNQHQKWVRWTVIGVVPSDIDLSDDIIAKNILREAVQFVLTQKDYAPGKGEIAIYLHQGKQYSRDTSFSYIINENKERIQLEIFAEHELPGYNEEIVWGKRDNLITPGSEGYVNLAQKSRIEEKRLAEQEERKRQIMEAEKREMETRKAKEEQEKQEAKKRRAEFAKKNKITAWLSIKSLQANPFNYEGKIVAVIPVWRNSLSFDSLVFAQMLTPTQGIFEGSNFGEAIVVSDIPKGLFTSKDTVVIIVGRVLGKTEIKNPFGGTISVPHLKFVDVYFCQYLSCVDILQN